LGKTDRIDCQCVFSAAAQPISTSDVVDPTRSRSNDRAHFRLILRAEPGCVDPIRALRALLKRALRSHSLRCIEVESLNDVTAGGEPVRNDRADAQ